MDPKRNANLAYRLKSLASCGAVLHVGAHPDDEDIGLLAYMARKYGARSVYWSATRGEGGQNRIGPYREIALGVFRTWESVAARVEDGGECLFGPFYDWGYSKTAEESLTKWGRENVVRELVRAIRMVQPQVVVARWQGTPADFHGQHQAVGQAVLEAYQVAGSPERFPELEKQGLAAWQPLKLYYSMDNSGGDLTVGGAANIFGKLNPAFERDGICRINTGEYDPIAGATYQEQAWYAYNKHQTQAMGLLPTPGDFFYYFALQDSRVPVPQRESSLFDGIDYTLTGLADHPGKDSELLRSVLRRVKQQVDLAIATFRPGEDEAPAYLLQAAVELQGLYEKLPNTGLDEAIVDALRYFMQSKITAFEELAARCLSLQIEFSSKRPHIISGDRFDVRVRLWNQGRTSVSDAKLKLQLPRNWQSMPLDAQSDTRAAQPSTAPFCVAAQDFSIVVGEQAELSCPYWLTQPKEGYVYQWPEGEPSGRPFGAPLVTTDCEATVNGYTLRMRAPMVFRQSFPGGYRELPIALVPPISLHPKADAEFLQAQSIEQCLDLRVMVRSNSEHASVRGELALGIPQGWRVQPEKVDIRLEKAGDAQTIQFKVHVPGGCAAGRYPLHYSVSCGGREYGTRLDAVRMGPPGNPRQPDALTCVEEAFITSPAEVLVHVIDAQFSDGLKFAYIQGVEEKIMDTLRNFNLDFHVLTDEEISYLDLSPFDTIVVGPNAYLVRDALRQNATRFLRYVETGGTLIVQYQGYGYSNDAYVPYPFRYNQPHDRVTFENAPITVLQPEHSLLSFPNKIGQEHFDDWVGDRGMYFFTEWDPHYEPILACNDPGEAPKKGGLLLAALGQGTFAYTGYSFHRQLRAGVPGGFALFANLLCTPAARIVERIESLRNSPLFSFMSDPQLEVIARIIVERQEEDGVYLCHEGDDGNELYIIVDGEVDIIREGADGDRIIFVAEKGQPVGGLAVFANIPRSAAMRTKGRSRFFEIHGDYFKALLRDHPDLSERVIEFLARQLAASERG